MISQFKAEGDKYVRRKKNDKSNREAQCLAMLAKFKSKVRAMGDMSEYNNDDDDKEGAVKEENSGSESDEGDGWYVPGHVSRSFHKIIFISISTWIREYNHIKYIITTNKCTYKSTNLSLLMNKIIAIMHDKNSRS